MYGSRFGWGGGYYPRGYMAAGLGYPYQGGWGYPGWGYGGYGGFGGYPGLGYGYSGYPYAPY
jgi:hypothetical protein